MELKEVRFKISQSLHDRLLAVSDPEVVRLGVFARQMMINGLKEYEKAEPDKRYHLLHGKEE